MNRYIKQGCTIRSCPAEETLANIQPFFKDFGITRLANVTGLDNIGIPVALCIRPNATSLSVSQGKGITQPIASTSAVMESIEHWHAENCAVPVITDSYEHLNKYYNAVNPINIGNDFFRITHLQSMVMEWSIGEDIYTGESVYIPTQFLSIDSTKINQLSALLSTSTNGLASGNTREEAICHAIYEIIERDCLYNWNDLNDRDKEKTCIKLKTINTSPNYDLIEKIKSAKLGIQVWDITSKLGIPTYKSIIYDNNILRGLKVFEGSGTHSNKEIALARAITEAAQSRLTIIAGSRDDILPSYYSKSLKKNKYISCKELIDFRKRKNFGTGESFAQDVNDLLVALKKYGYNDIYVYDYTQTQFSIPVIRVIIPGINFFRE